MKKIKFLLITPVLLIMFVFLSQTTYAYNQPSDIGNVSIVADGSGLYGTHAFLVYENTSSEDYYVGKYLLESGEMVTIGTWGNKEDGKGIYYNLEAYFINKHSAYEGRVSLTISFSNTELATMNGVISNNNYWTLAHNCATFATRVWNSISGSSLKIGAGLIHNPSTVATNIKKKSGYKTNIKVNPVTDDNVLRHDGNTTKPVSSGSLSSGSSS